MQQFTGWADVAVLPVVALDDGVTVLEVPGVAVAFGIGRNAVVIKVGVTTVTATNGAASLLEVAAPTVAFGV